ncbi:hypothetical protein HY502_01190 [Candidatus Woesebacteria bacterium]|nr:hypothetical protein [Candidatus Woesebacteria bacterium]
MANLPYISPELISQYQGHVASTSAEATTKRRISSLKKFFDWAQREGHVVQNPFVKRIPEDKKSSLGKLSKRIKIALVLGGTLGMAVIALLLVSKLGTTIPFRLAPAQEPTSNVQVGTPRPSAVSEESGTGTPPLTSASAWTLYNKLKFTDESGEPVQGVQSITFSLYPTQEGTSPIWTSSAQEVVPDSEGNVRVILKDVPTNLFFENETLFLEANLPQGVVAERIPIPTASNPGESQEALVGDDGNLLLAGESPSIVSESGNLLIEGQAVTITTATASDGDIEINPDGSGIVHFLFEGSGQNFLNAQAPNLTRGSLYYGIVANNSTGYDLIRLQNGSKATTRFAVDAGGNTSATGNLAIGGGILTSGLERLTSGGALTNITGYSQSSGNFSITQTGGETATITKKDSALADLLTITLDERGKKSTGYSALTLKRYDGATEGYALFVDEGNARFDGQLQLGRFGSNPSAGIGEGSLIYNSTDDTVYAWDGSSWNTISGGSSALIIQEGDTTVAAAASTLDFLGGDFDISESPANEANVQLAATLTSVTGIAGDLSIGGGDLTTAQTTATLFNTTVTTLNIGGAATTNLNAATFGGHVTLSGDASEGLSGGGLTDCDTSTTSKLLWDATTNKFSCGTDQDTGAATTTLQIAYGNDGDGSDAIIALTTADDSLIFRNPAASGTDSTYLLFLDQLAAGDVNTLQLSNDGTGSEIALTSTTPTIEIANTGTLTVTDGTNILFSIADDTSEGDVTVTGDLAVNGATSADITSSNTTATLFNTTVTTLNIGGAATTTLNTAIFTGHVTLSSDASEGLSGGGLSDCDTAGTSKLLWDATTNKFSCGTDQDSGASTTTLQIAYNNDADGSDAVIALTTADDSLIFRNPASAGTDSGFLLFLDQLNTTAATTVLDITQASNAADAVNITANSIDTENALDISATGLTTGKGISLTAGSSLTTGNLISVSSATYAPAAAATGTLVNLSLTDAATNTSGNSTVNALNVSSTLNTSGATGTKEFNALNVASPTFTACTDGACTWSGLKVGGSTAGATITEYGVNIGSITAGAGSEIAINIGAGWDTGIDAGTNSIINIGDTGTDITSSGATFGVHVTLSSDASEGLSGGGLSDCDNATTSKLLWDATTNKFSCGTDGDTGASTTTLQIAYNNDADGSDAIIALTTADDSLIFRNPAASGTDSAFTVFIDQLNTTGAVTALDISQASNAADAVNITANSIDDENVLDISATALTSGVGIKFTGPTATGITGSALSLTSDVGSAGELINLAPDFSGAGVTGYGTYLSGTQSANAANIAIGYYGTLSSSSTTADTLAVFDAATTTSGIITTGTRNLYGVRSQPNSTGASTGGITNVYGVYSKADGTVGIGGTINAYGLYVANGTMDTTGTSTNIGLYVEAPTGATTNYAAIFAGGNIGIGDTSPAYLLTLGSGDLFGIDGAANTSLFWEGSGADDFETSLTVVNPTADIIYRLADAAAGTYDLCSSSGNCLTGGGAATLQTAYAAGNTITTTTARDIEITLADVATDTTFEITQVGAADAFRVNDDGTFTDTTAFTIDQAGNVGIGDTTPSELLNVGTGNSNQAVNDGVFITGDLELDETLYLDGLIVANSEGLSTIQLSSAGTTTAHQLLNGAWKVSNSVNTGGLAAFSVVQSQTGDIFTGLDGATTRFKVAEDGTTTITTTNAATVASLIVTDASGTGAGKINVGTVDPIYTIGDGKYATYMASMVGIKEETTGTVQTDEFIPGIGYRKIIDFKAEEQGSDLWLFSKTTDLKDNIDKIVVLLSPEGNNRAWYRVDEENYTLSIYSTKPTNVSYRLTAPRFDHALWTNYNHDEGVSGFILQDEDLTANGEIDNPDEDSISNYEIEKIETNEGTFYQLKDLAGQVINEFAKVSDFLVANITAGILRADSVVTNNLEVGLAIIDELKVNDKLISPIIETETIKPLTDSSDVTVQIGSESSQSGFGKLIVENAQNEEVASIDTEGNATFSGTLEADSIQTNDITAGKIYADEIVARNGYFGETQTESARGITREEIEAILAEVEESQNLLTQAATWSVNTATGSGVIDETVINNLFVTGLATVNSLYAAESLTVGSDLVIQPASTEYQVSSINTLQAPLALQSLALAPVEIMAGKVRIETNGDVKIEGNLYVAGTIESQTIKAEEATLNKLTTDQLIIAGAETATSSAQVSGGEITTNATVGATQIAAGVTEITIRNPKITDYTLVYITPTSDTQNKTLYVKSKGSGFFTVGFSDPLSVDTTLNWWIIEAGQ